MANTVERHFEGRSTKDTGETKMLTVKIRAMTGVFVVSLAAVGFFLGDRHVVAGQSYSRTGLRVSVTPSPSDKKTFSEYKGVAIGNTADMVRLKLGVPKDKSDEQDFYIFSDNESAQFYYDASHLVTAIMITYSGNLKNAPTPLAVFGEDAPPKPDGSIFKMVRYPKAGYWVSYNRSGGDDAVISVAIQKI